MKSIPKEIYLQIDADGETPEDFNELHQVTWCKDKINKNDIKYVLALPSPDNTARTAESDSIWLTELGIGFKERELILKRFAQDSKEVNQSKITDKEYRDLNKMLYPKDNSKKFRP